MWALLILGLGVARGGEFGDWTWADDFAPTSPHGPLVVHRRNSSETRPNFIYFLPDETRAESLGTYGHPLTKTPNYDRFAAEGTLFEQCHVLHTQCSPSRVTFMTGRPMHVMGHRTQTHLIQPWEDNWFKYFKNAGYHVYWRGKNDMLAADSFPISVDDWEGVIGVEMGPNPYKEGEEGYYSFLRAATSVPGNSTLNKDYAAVVDALNFLASSPPEPFVIWLPGMGAHPPYGAPSPWYSMYNPNDIRSKAPLRPPMPPNKPKYFSLDAGIPHWRNISSWSTGDMQKLYEINSIYLGRVSYSDWIFGQLLDGITKLGYDNTTVVAISADHGDFSADSGLVEKWPGGLDDMLTRVPMIVRTPGGVKGQRVAAPINAYDTWATFMDLAGINTTHVHFARSFRERLYGNESGFPAPDNVVYSEGGFFYMNEIEAFDPSQHSGLYDNASDYWPRYAEDASDFPDGSPRAVMWRNATHKLVYRPRGQSELYDYTSDPRELKNLWGEPAMKELQDFILADLLAWYVQTGDVTPSVDDPRGLPPSPKPSSACPKPTGSNAIPSFDDLSTSPWQWTVSPNGQVATQVDTHSLCLTGPSSPVAQQGQVVNLTLTPCTSPPSPTQVFTANLTSGQFMHSATKYCLNQDSRELVTKRAILWPCLPWPSNDGDSFSLFRNPGATTSSLALVATKNEWGLTVCGAPEPNPSETEGF